MKIKFFFKSVIVLLLIVNLSKADDKIKRIDKSTWVESNESRPGYAPFNLNQEPCVFINTLAPAFQTDAYLIGPEILTANSGFYDYKTNGETNHYLQVDPANPLLYNAIDVQADSLDATGVTSRRTFYSVSIDGGLTWERLGQVPEIRSGYPVLKLKASKAIIANHSTASGILNVNLYEDIVPQGGAFNQYNGTSPGGIWAQIAVLGNGNAVVLSRPQHITGSDFDTLFYQTWNGTVMGPKSILYVSEPPYIGTVGSNLKFNIATNGAGRVTVAINSILEDDTLGNSKVWQRTSTDNGATWGPLELVFTPYLDGNDTIAVAGGCDLVYKQNSNEWYYSFAASANGLYSTGRIYVVKSDGTRSTVTTSAAVGSTSDYYKAMAFVYSIDQPSMGFSSDGSVLYCVYSVVKPDTGASGFNSRDIYYQRSIDNGLTWGIPVQITNTPDIDECYPSVSDWNKSSPYDLNFTYMKDAGVGPASFNGSSALAPPSRNFQIFRKVSDANVIGISNNQTDLNDFRLNQNYPNPFNPTTTIGYNLVKNGFVTLKIYNTLGREVKTLVNEFQQSGLKEISFNASDLSSGVYFYRITIGGFSDLKKMMLIK